MSSKITIVLQGGLGNEMFQVALGESLKEAGRNVDYYIDGIPVDFCGKIPVEATFSGIEIPRSDRVRTERDLRKVYSQSLLAKLQRKFMPWLSTIYLEKAELQYDDRVYKSTKRMLKGYWQSYLYFEMCVEHIYDVFQFPELDDEYIKALIRKMRETESVALHVRGGDYNSIVNEQLFGGICTSAYYENAISYFRNSYQNVCFFVFTNDLQYAKRILNDQNLVWVNTEHLSQQWVDMYLMTQCHHNIVANSSYSWWGAFLNRYPQKVVVAPKKWLNIVEEDQICCDNWTRM